MNTFREKAKLGYEHVIDWSQPRTHRMSITSDAVFDEVEDEDLFETVDEIDQQQEIVVTQGEEEEVKDNGFEQIVVDESKVEIIESIQLEELPKPEIICIDADVQVQPDCDDQQVSTEDNLFTKY